MFDDRVFDRPIPAPEEGAPQERPVPPPPPPHEEPHGHPVPPPPPPPHHGPHGPGGPHHPAPPPPPPPGHHAPPPPPPHHGPHGPHIDPERYAELDTDGKLMALILALGHAGRFHFDERGGQRRALGLLPAEGPMTQRELTERLGIQPGSASELVGKLERAGLIARTPSETDRRTADIRLTEAGLARRQEQEQERSGRESLFAVLSEEEKQTLLALLEKLHQAWLAMPKPEPPRPGPGPRPEPGPRSEPSPAPEPEPPTPGPKPEPPEPGPGPAEMEDI